MVRMTEPQTNSNYVMPNKSPEFRLNDFRFHMNHDVLRGLSDTDYRAFLFHDMGNLPTGTNFLRLLPGLIQESDKDIVAALDVFTQRGNANTSNLQELIDTMNMLKQYVISEGVSTRYRQSVDAMREKIDTQVEERLRPMALENLESIKKNIDYIPVAADLTACYVDFIRFMQIPNKIDLDALRSKRLKLGDVISKYIPKSKDHIDMDIDGADALIAYTVANKFSGDCKDIEWGIEADGSIVFNGTILNNIKTPGRFKRYESLLNRPVPPPIDLTSESSSDVSPGLFAAELLGYATGKEILFSNTNGRARVTISKSTFL